MATRGHYTFTQHGRTESYYVHQDNYPSGAADKLSHAIDATGDRLSQRFVSTVSTAEPDDDHEWDANYEYHIAASDDGSWSIDVVDCMYCGNPPCRIFRGSLGEFFRQAEALNRVDPCGDDR